MIRWFMKISDIITTTTIPPVTLFQGFWFETQNVDPKTEMNIYYQDAACSDWQTHRVILDLALIHHFCNGCTLQSKCGKHMNADDCPASCPLSRYQLVHANTNEFLIAEKYRNLSS